MSNIEPRKRKDGSVAYRAKVRIKGYHLTETFDRKRDAVAWATQTEADIQSRRLFGHSATRTVDDLVAAYLDSPDFAVLSGCDQRSRRIQLRWFVGFYGDTLAHDLTRRDVREFLDALTDGETPSGQPASPATRNRYLAAVSKALSWGVDREWIRHSPAHRIKRLREQPRIRYLTRAEDVGPGEEPELPRFLASIRESTDPRLYPAVLIMLATGCRRSELFAHPDGTHTQAARWRDVTLTAPDGTARIRIQRAKSGHAKTLVLSGSTAEALREYARVQPLDRDELLFSRNGYAFWPRKEYDAALGRAGIEEFPPHALCHTAISYMVMAGRSLAEVAEATDRTYAILQRYAHLSPSHAAGVTRSAQEVIDGAG